MEIRKSAFFTPLPSSYFFSFFPITPHTDTIRRQPNYHLEIENENVLLEKFPLQFQCYDEHFHFHTLYSIVQLQLHKCRLPTQSNVKKNYFLIVVVFYVGDDATRDLKRKIAIQKKENVFFSPSLNFIPCFFLLPPLVWHAFEKNERNRFSSTSDVCMKGKNYENDATEKIDATMEREREEISERNAKNYYFLLFFPGQWGRFFFFISKALCKWKLEFFFFFLLFPLFIDRKFQLHLCGCICVLARKKKNISLFSMLNKVWLDVFQMR